MLAHQRAGPRSRSSLSLGADGINLRWNLRDKSEWRNRRQAWARTFTGRFPNGFRTLSNCFLTTQQALSILPIPESLVGHTWKGCGMLYRPKGRYLANGKRIRTRCRWMPSQHHISTGRFRKINRRTTIRTINRTNSFQFGDHFFTQLQRVWQLRILPDICDWADITAFNLAVVRQIL